MKTRLVGVHRVRARLADGSVAEYFYAWRGGPRIRARPGTQAFVQEFARLTRQRHVPVDSDTLGALCDDYLASPAFRILKASTRRDYERIVAVVRVRFATLPLAAIEEKGARALFLRWRDAMASTPRSADMHLAVLARILSWAKDRETILRNPLERFERLHTASRKDSIWMPGQLATLLADGAPHLADVARLALWTMQRQGDVLAMPTIAYDGGRLWITQGKTGARVRIRPPDEIMPIIERAKAAGRQRMLANSYGQNWTSSGFRASWRREMRRLGIAGVTFHDLRGTGISYAYALGVPVARIAEISGHGADECEAIIRRHYLAGADVIEAIRSGTKGA